MGKSKATYLIIAGVIMCLLGVMTFVGDNSLSSKMERYSAAAEGKVTGSEARNFITTGRQYVVTVEFDVDGETREETKTARTEAEVGSAVTVHYDPSDPAQNYIEGVEESEFIQKGRSLILAAVGVFVIFLGIQGRRMLAEES